MRLCAIHAYLCISDFQWKEKQYFTDIALVMVMVMVIVNNSESDRSDEHGVAKAKNEKQSSTKMEVKLQQIE